MVQNTTHTHNDNNNTKNEEGRTTQNRTSSKNNIAD